MIPYNKRLKTLSKELRKNMTDSERQLWSRIRGKQLNGSQFYRQKPVGNYIVDFYCSSEKLVIEIDGGQHYTENGKENDMLRDEFLNSLGLQVLRFSSRDVLTNIDAVLQKIFNCLK